MTLVTFTVTQADTAQALGSGDVPVLGTPRLLAWIEQATVLAVAPLLDPGSTTVGVQVELTHSRASRVGARVQVEVLGIELQDPQIVLEAVARELTTAIVGPVPAGTDTAEPATAEPGPEVGRARVVRAKVDRARFLARLEAVSSD